MTTSEKAPLPSTERGPTECEFPDLWETLDELIDRYGINVVRNVIDEIEEERDCD